MTIPDWRVAVALLIVFVLVAIFWPEKKG